MPLPPPRWMVWTNVLLFQLGWFAIVLAAARGHPWVAMIVAVAASFWHVAHAPKAGREIALIGVAVGFGVVFETLLARFGVVTAESGILVAGTAAYWLVCLWALFSTTFNLSLRWLRPRPFLAAALGAVGGPLAYLGGAELGALRLEPLIPALAVLAIGWAGAMPVLLRTAQRLDGYGAA